MPLVIVTLKLTVAVLFGEGEQCILSAFQLQSREDEALPAQILDGALQNDMIITLHQVHVHKVSSSVLLSLQRAVGA